MMSRFFQFAEATQRTKHPYGYGMILLCVGALINWLGLAQNYVEPVRYVGVACIVMGVFLICLSMCCWLRRPVEFQETVHDGGIQTIEVPITPNTVTQPKPPDYNSVSDSPPSYDDAVKLNPALLLVNNQHTAESPPSYSAGNIRT